MKRLFLGPPGCLAGDTVVQYRRGIRNSGRDITLRRLYQDFNGLSRDGDKRGRGWQDGHTTFLHSLMPDGRVTYNAITAVVDSGEKPVVLARFDDGSNLRLTDDHEVCIGGEEFVAIGLLKPGQTVIARGSMKPLPRNRRPLSARPDRVIVNTKYHPRGGYKAVKYQPSDGGPPTVHEYTRVARSVLVFEAARNGLDYDEFARLLNTDPGVGERLWFVPTGHEIHHENEIANDDRLSNLVMMTTVEHSRHHAHGKFKGVDYTREVRLVSVTPDGVAHTYDVVMAEPARNFVANGIVVHNCGKTTKLLHEIEVLCNEGYHLHQIGFVSFTRRAIGEARERGAKVFGCEPDQIPWFRTLHSSFAAACSMRNWMKSADYKQFGLEHHYSLGNQSAFDIEDGCDEIAVVEKGVKTKADALMAADEYRRARDCTFDEAALKCRVSVRDLRNFSDEYRRFKGRVGKADFTDILEEAARRGVRLPVEVLIVDEAQDLNPLQIKAILPTIAAAREVIVAGDDDQAIFTFQGSSPEWLMQLARSSDWHTEVLSQSWRVPRLVHGVAQSIIGRNFQRVPKVYAPRPADGSVVSNIDAISEVMEESPNIAFLARSRAGTYAVAEELFKRKRVAFQVLRGMGPNPLGQHKAIAAVTTAHALMVGAPVLREELVALLSFIPSREKLELLPWGAKSKVEGYEHSIIQPVEYAALGLAKIQAHAREHGHCAVLLKLAEDWREWFAAMWKLYGKIPAPTAVLSTIHSVKGAEWPEVIVSPILPWPAEQNLKDHDEREAENRVAYVAVTRARERLYVARPTGRYNYPYPGPGR